MTTTKKIVGLKITKVERGFAVRRRSQYSCKTPSTKTTKMGEEGGGERDGRTEGISSSMPYFEGKFEGFLIVCLL